MLCADRVAVLREAEGRIEQLGTPEELALADGWYRDNFGPQAREQHEKHEQQ